MTARTAAALGAALLCAGCPSPNTYTTPRAIPAGKIQHSIAVQGAAAIADGSETAIAAAPAYTARIGLADRFDLGVHLSPPSIGFDLKWNPLRSAPFDLAVDPGAETFANTSLSEAPKARVYYLHLPLLLGLNVAPSLTLVATPGVSYLKATGDVDDDANFYDPNGRVIGRMGLGAQLRIARAFAVHPEVTALGPYDGGGWFIAAGLGFNFGAFRDCE